MKKIESGIDARRTTRRSVTLILAAVALGLLASTTARADDSVGIGVTVGCFQRQVDQIHAVIAADGNEIGAVAGRLFVGCDIVFVELRRMRRGI